jgi:hypothetical protein
MGKLSQEEQDALDKLQAKLDGPDEEDYEIEIGSGEHRARIPYSKGRKFLQDHFGIDLDPDPSKETGEGEQEGQTPKAPQRTSQKYFGKAKTSE